MNNINKPFQRIGSTSNSHVGKDFEALALSYFSKKGIKLRANIKIPIGVNEQKKKHAFDLGCEVKRIIVECKSHTWTSGKNVPSAKLTVWNEAMYYFQVAPTNYRKIMFVLRSECDTRKETLAEYYLRRYYHLIPNDVELLEYDIKKDLVQSLSFNR